MNLLTPTLAGSFCEDVFKFALFCSLSENLTNDKF